MKNLQISFPGTTSPRPHQLFLRKLVLLLSALLLFTLIPPALIAEDNPFFSGGTNDGGGMAEGGDTTDGGGMAEGGTTEGGTAAGEELDSIGGGADTDRAGKMPLGSRLLSWIISTQRVIHGRMVKLFRSSTSEGMVIPLLLGAAMLYGMVHAIGPGHRKTVLFSYFLSRGGRPWHGTVAGFGLAAVHAGSAVLVVWTIHGILHATFSSTLNNTQSAIETISYLAIGAMGIILLLHVLGELRSIRRDREETARSTGAENHSETAPTEMASTETADQPTPTPTASKDSAHQKRNMGLLILSAGVVPCPGAATILVFGITLQAIPLAVGAVAAMSFGMGVTLSVVAVLTITMKEGLLSLVGGGKKGEILALTLEGVGALFILLFGLFMGMPGLFSFFRG